MDWLLSDITHFLAIILGGGFIVLVGTLIVIAIGKGNRAALIHHNPEQLVGPYQYAPAGIYLGSAKAEGGPARFLYGGPAHITTIGPTRTGKSRRLLNSQPRP